MKEMSSRRKPGEVDPDAKFAGLRGRALPETSKTMSSYSGADDSTTRTMAPMMAQRPNLFKKSPEQVYC